MANPVAKAGHDARQRHGWLHAHRWLLLRRACQLTVLLMFLSGPWWGFGCCAVTTVAVCCSIPYL